MTKLPKDVLARIEREAEQYVLDVEWNGHDYGLRKKYYSDCYKFGAIAEAERAQEVIEAAERLIEKWPPFLDEEHTLKTAIDRYREGEKK